MKLNIKQKVVNGKIQNGMINEDLDVIAPFEFKDINSQCVMLSFGDNRYYHCYVCEKDDGACSLYDEEGKLRISHEEGYTNLKLLRIVYDDRYHPILYISACKDGEIGILKSYYWNKFRLETAYKFGKCDEIKKYGMVSNDNNATIELIKHTKTGDRIGYFYQKELNLICIVDPKYLQYEHFTIENPYNAKFGSYYSNYGNYISSVNYKVGLVKYKKLKNRKELIGIKQRTAFYTSYGYEDSMFKDLLLCEYSNITYDSNNQVFFLEQTKNGEVKKGFVGGAFYWDYYRGAMYGHAHHFFPMFAKKVDVPCEYDDIKIIYSKDEWLTRLFYAILKRNGKYAVNVSSYRSVENDCVTYEENNYKFETETTSCGRNEGTECIFDDISSVAGTTYFIGKIGDEEQIICFSEHNEYYHYHCLYGKFDGIIANNYKKVNHLFKNVFECELENGKKQIIKLAYKSQKLEVENILQCDSTKVIELNKNTSLIVVSNNGTSDVYSFKTDLEKLVEDISDISYDKENKHIIITENNGYKNYLNYNGELIFLTIGISNNPNNLDVSYLPIIGKFMVKEGNIIKICSRINDTYYNMLPYDNREFLAFNIIQKEGYLFIQYSELIENKVISKLVLIDGRIEKELLKGEYQIENIILGGKRIIYSSIDSVTGNKKYGVIETSKGNNCIDCSFDNIVFDSDNQVFVCTLVDKNYNYDTDGFIIDNSKKLARTIQQ